MCRNATMVSRPTTKPLNPKAKPWLPLSLPQQIYHKPPPLLQQPPPPTPPAELWIAAPPSMYLNKFTIQYFDGVYPLPGLSYYNTGCQTPFQEQTQFYPLVYSAGFDCGTTTLCGGGGVGEKGGMSEVVEKEQGMEKGGVGVNRVGPHRFRSRRGKTCRESRCWTVWKPNKCKFEEDAGGGGGGGGGGVVHSSTPPEPFSPTPSKDGVPLSGKTTVMIKNIPNQYRRSMLLDFLDKLCQHQNQKAKLQTDHPVHFEYDFVYLPIDFRGDNLGYAFVNFTNAFAATRIREFLQNFKWGVFTDSCGALRESRKICEITWARIQGKYELEKHFRNSNFVCYNVEYLPVVLSPPRDGTISFTLPKTIGRCLALAAANSTSGEETAKALEN